MEIFSKQINMSNKNIKLSFTAITVVGIIITIFFMIISPINAIFVKKKQLKMSINMTKRILVKSNLLQKRYDSIKIEKEKQQLEYLNLMKNFNSLSVTNENELKKMIQTFLNYLDIKLLEVGKTETELVVDKNRDKNKKRNISGIVSKKEQFQKKIIHYRIAGSGKNIILFFYYLEHSNLLVSMKNSRLEAKKIPSTDNLKDDINYFEVSFNLMYYKLLTNIGGKIKKPIVQKISDTNPLSQYISDEIYNSGKDILNNKKNHLFKNHSDSISTDEKDFSKNINAKFKLKLLLVHNDINYAIIYYLDNSDKGRQKRFVVHGIKIIKLDNRIYIIKAYKDKIKIDDSSVNKSIYMYLKGR